MDAPSAPRQRRRWLRFSLRTMLLVTAAIGIWLGFTMAAARRQQAAVNAILDAGGTVVFDYEASLPPNGAFGKNPTAVVPGPAWLRAVLGDDYFRTPITVMLLDGSKVDDDLVDRYVSSLRQLEILEIVSPDVTDKSMAAIGRLTDLNTLMLVCPKVTADGLFELKNLKALSDFVCLRDIKNENLGHKMSQNIGGLTGFADCSLSIAVQAFNDFSTGNDMRVRIDPQITKDVPVNNVEFEKKSTRTIFETMLKGTGMTFMLDQGDVLVVPLVADAPAWSGYNTMSSQFPNLNTLNMDW